MMTTVSQQDFSLTVGKKCGTPISVTIPECSF